MLTLLTVAVIAQLGFAIHGYKAAQQRLTRLEAKFHRQIDSMYKELERLKSQKEFGKAQDMLVGMQQRDGQSQDAPTVPGECVIGPQTSTPLANAGLEDLGEIEQTFHAAHPTLPVVQVQSPRD